MVGTRPRARLAKEHLELALGAAGLGEFQYDVPGDFYIVTERMAAITGGEAGYIPAKGGRALWSRIHPDDFPMALEQMRAGFAAQDRYEIECRAAPQEDRPTVWLRVAAQRIRNAEGEIDGVIGIVEDITARKVEEQRSRALMAEIDHRVKNVLATVQALAQQTAKRTTSVDSFLQAFIGRLKSLGSANELLTAARWRGAAIDHLAAAELGGLAPGQTRWEGPDLFLTPRAATGLSQALHELATNALKYGALSVETGEVQVTWRPTPEGGFVLEWLETGGPVVAPPAQEGFGATLLNQVTPPRTQRPHHPGLSAHRRAGQARGRAVGPGPPARSPPRGAGPGGQRVATVLGRRGESRRRAHPDRRGRRPAGHGTGDGAVGSRRRGAGAGL
ncbi:MAG TPA: HWE histidine kinase domain-containing protein [Phenylobacterium sp.]|nr:HWE histidine kinase domain-containing protein [Phenylobacterium sp.]